MFANVNATVDKHIIEEGEIVQYTISSNAQDVKFPDLDNIGGFDVVYSSNSSNISVVNGKTTREIRRTYNFYPDLDLTIPSYKVLINGKGYATNSIDIKIKKPNQKIDAKKSFKVEFLVDKNEVYVGEEINASLIVKQLRGVEFLDIRLEALSFENFWIKKSGNETQSIEDNYIIHKIPYKLYAQKSGELVIPKVKISVAQPNKQFSNFGMFASPPTWRIYKSDEISIKATALPSGVKIVGEFRIESKVDKRVVKSGEAVNLEVEVIGKGNIDDLEDYVVEIPDTSIFSDKSKVQELSNGEIKKSFKFAIISSKSYEIPSIKLNYFDTNKKSVIIKKTPPIKIEIESKELEEVVIKKSTQDVVNVQTVEGGIDKWFYFIAGILSAILMFAVSKLFGKKRVKKELNLNQKIKKTKSDKELLELLLPQLRNYPELKDVVMKLEENLYKGASHKIVRRDIMIESES